MYRLLDAGGSDFLGKVLERNFAVFPDFFFVLVVVSQQKPVQLPEAAVKSNAAESVCGGGMQCSGISDFTWSISGWIIEPPVLPDH